jgi:hypothetical protein
MPDSTCGWGDALNGFVAHCKVETWVEVEAWLRDQALAHYPDSNFAKSAARAAEGGNPVKLGGCPGAHRRLHARLSAVLALPALVIALFEI